jgi:uncharacterized protein VirK/YbjX
MLNFIEIGKQIYDMDNPREVHRMIVFVIRAYLHYPTMENLYQFFQKNDTCRVIMEKNKFPIEQATRAFFYKGSTLAERVRLICNHFIFLQDRWKEDALISLYDEGIHRIWQSEDEDIDWYVQLVSRAGQRKEGLMSVEMMLGDEQLYQIMFWLDKDKNDEYALWIGAMQGPNMEHAKDIIKDITKRSFRYRTKNLILYMTMAVARALEVKHIYAISNEGYYANNHVRRDRKLKTDFGTFWEEAGGHVTEDKRFYEVPLVEPRKTIEEVPTRKRAVYRKRFAFQDEVDSKICDRMAVLAK